MSGQTGPKSRWGSLLSQAVAGVEARLDTILAEDEPPKLSPSPSPSPTPSQQSKSSIAPSRSDSTRSRPADRLQERLVRAVAAKQAGPKGEGSSARPSPSASPRQSLDVQPTRTSADSASAVLPPPSPPVVNPEAHAPLPTSQETNSISSDTAEASANDTTVNASPAPPDDSSPELSNGAAQDPDDGSNETKSSAGLVTALQADRIKQVEKALEELAAQHHEETHNYVEQIDALQAKLQYLARAATESARREAREAPTGSLEKKMAEKDQQICGLMEEGKNLASTEQKLRSIIKSLRSKIIENEKEINDVKTSRGKAEQELDALRKRARRADDLEKSQEELLKRIGQSQKDMDGLKSEASNKDRTIADLRLQLQKSAQEKETLASKINEEALSKERHRVRLLEEEISDLKVEKELVADRGRAREIELKEKGERAAERARAVELEMKAELQVMERKLESMRVMAEEVSSGAIGDSQAQLLRQVETLQTQYAIATENWQGIESTLLARVSSLEKERDEARDRESEMRKKAREASLRAKRHEEELEMTKTHIPSIQKDVKSCRSQIESLKKRAEDAEAALAVAEAEFNKHKSAVAEEKAAKDQDQDQDRQGQWMEDAPPTTCFKPSSRPESPPVSIQARTFNTELLGFGSLSTKLRKPSAPSSNGDPMDRYGSRRPSGQPPGRPPLHTGNSHPLPPILSLSIEALPTAPSVHPLERQDTYDSVEMASSPRQIVQDMVSVSTMAAGPSVQLVEKLSAAIRRLETEKVAAREELARISSQRDEARAEIVALMRDIENGKKASEEVRRLRDEVAEVKDRYDTTLELLGEKSEQVEELTADVQDVKAMYRDLVERTIK